MYTFLKLHRSYTVTLYILCFNITKIATDKGNLRIVCIFLCMIFVLTCWRVA